MELWKRITYFILCFNLVNTQLTTTVHKGDNDVDSFDVKSDQHVQNQKMSTDRNGKPMFKDCENYKPSVKEEQEKGTPVITVKAVDNDPVESGGTLQYKIVNREGERTYFTINNVTGEIKTNIPFDRDEPTRQKELYLTVQAMDNGRPALADICTFKVTVTDINDNPPSFDQAVYNAQVSEDLKVDSEVMRVFAYDVDDGENSRMTYSFDRSINDGFSSYFKIDPTTGVVYLKQSLQSKKDTKFSNTVVVTDNGAEPHRTTADISITVVGSDKQPPKIKSYDPSSVTLKENFIDFSAHLVTIEAESSIADKEVVFELVKGKTAQTNKDQTFLLTPSDKNDNTAYITLVRPLDYETVTEYTLTVRVKNKDFMDVSINIPITITDVNDETPNFIELLKGSVVENDAPGVQAMQVRAIDKDGTSENNQVSYELLSHTDIFSIDNKTGVIKSKKQFDREEISLYHVKVRAYDNSPSAILNTVEPNSVIQAFQISIEDRNDNSPQFSNSIYYIHNISESADKAKDVGEVKALDKDTASLISYSIVEGNIGDVFAIENTTGRIKVNGQLDYEKIEKYTLTVRAFDGIYEDTAKVIIYIQNENDEPPKFEAHDKEIKLEEEKLVNGCIIRMQAHDPDIKDRTANQRIVFEVDKEKKDFLNVDNDGCVSLIKPLDRDKPYGSPTRQVFIYAYDNDGAQHSLNSFTEIEIVLIDINDNAPFLNVTEIVWYENRDPGVIGPLSADDYDSENNGPPFTFQIADSASYDIQNKFAIENGQLTALVQFDREQQKYYDIPVMITDSGIPPQSGISYLRVIIGDVNDNAAKDGTSEIFVYKYEKLNADITIGRVYVEDPDDWDLNDKVFIQETSNDNFYLSSTDNGMIIMRPSAVEGSYNLEFGVTEHQPDGNENRVNAKVNVTIKEIIEEAVYKSGSIRLQGSTIEEFVEKQADGLSKKDLLRNHLSKMLNTSRDNVDVFTVLKSPSNSSLIDVRFSAHGSPYYAPEKLNNKATEHQDELQQSLGVEFVMISISECLNETVCNPGVSCSSRLKVKDEPAVVFTNKTSFVGVKAVVERTCDCLLEEQKQCFNGGTLIEGTLCSCPSGFEGPHCEILSIGFNDDGGWAMYKTFDACNNTEITLFVSPLTENGLVFYVGPMTLRHARTYKDFMALEIKDGYPYLMLNFGEQTIEILSNKKKLSVGSPHKIRITYYSDGVEMEIDDCKSQCLELKNFKTKGLLNVNGPLQLGGMKYTFNTEESKMIWGHPPPTTKRFAGCIQNFTINGFLYNLGAPSDQYHAYADCNYGVIAAVTFGIDSNFLVAILVCIALLIILLLAVVVHRRKQDNLNEKDIDDTRENIINYEDEGGGECDTNYDLSVFRSNLDEKPILKDNVEMNADISGFLDTKKDSCDKNPENLPYDDVRHYAYEGDGNSTGSLSSLASCTDEGDLKFNYLSSFGSRFRKLADIYGEDLSDEDSHDGGEESWC